MNVWVVFVVLTIGVYIETYTAEKRLVGSRSFSAMESVSVLQTINYSAAIVLRK
jgi:hypothetical protein